MTSITAIMGMPYSLPIATFYGSRTSDPVTACKVQLEREENGKFLSKLVGDTKAFIEKESQSNNEKVRKSSSTRKMPTFKEWDFFLMAREDSHAGEKLC